MTCVAVRGNEGRWVLYSERIQRINERRGVPTEDIVDAGILATTDDDHSSRVGGDTFEAGQGHVQRMTAVATHPEETRT